MTAPTPTIDLPTRDELLGIAWGELKPKGSRKEITLFEFRHAVKVETFAIQERYTMSVVEYWADRALDRVPTKKLLGLEGTIWELVAERGLHWEIADEEDRASQAAYGIAVLRWLNQERAGRVAVPEYEFTDEELEAYLLRRQPRQLALFEETG